MAKVQSALAGLEPEVVGRVLRWAGERHGVLVTPTGRKARGSGDGSADSEAIDLTEFDDVTSLVEAANPSTDADRVLVVGYWFQEQEKSENVGSQEINTVLKNLGHGIRDMTRPFGHLTSTSPKLVIQVRKSGNTQQARKRYKVTAAGKKRVRALIAGTADTDS